MGSSSRLGGRGRPPREVTLWERSRQKLHLIGFSQCNDFLLCTWMPLPDLSVADWGWRRHRWSKMGRRRQWPAYLMPPWFSVSCVLVSWTGFGAWIQGGEKGHVFRVPPGMRRFKSIFHVSLSTALWRNEYYSCFLGLWVVTQQFGSKKGGVKETNIRILRESLSIITDLMLEEDIGHMIY